MAPNTTLASGTTSSTTFAMLTRAFPGVSLKRSSSVLAAKKKPV
jgi:hypothetical protein